MLLDSARYSVIMSRTMYRWLVYDAVRPTVDAGPTAWTHGGRVAYGRLETLYARLRQVEFAGEGGRVVRLTSKDARTVMGLVELARSLGFSDPPPSARSLAERLRWQVGDVDRFPGTLPEQARTMRLMPVGPGQYLSTGGGTLSAPRSAT